MGQITEIKGLGEIFRSLKTARDISVIPRDGKKIVRIPWLNLFNDPVTLNALASVIDNECRERGYCPDAIASIETSGAKYGVATSLKMGIPYFSIHKFRKIIFLDTVVVKGRSITEDKEIELYLDKEIAERFNRVILVDDIRRTSRTIDSALELLEKCGCHVEACFTILDLKFAGHPLPSRIPADRYHPLFVISSIDEVGRCVIENGVALRYLGDGDA